MILQNPSDGETNEAIVFGNQVSLFIMEFVRLAEKRPICVHFHEWLASVGLIRLKQMSVPIASLFTVRTASFWLFWRTVFGRG
jgi:glycogen synthase